MKHTLSSSKVQVVEQNFLNQVYGWMASALAISGGVAYYMANYQIELIAQIMSGGYFWILILAQVGLVIALSAGIRKFSVSVATLLFYLYAVSVGFTLATVFLVYTASSIASTFLITAGTFAAMSIYGYTTKKDLSSMGSMFFMLLIGLIIASLVNLFLQSPAIYWLTTFIGIFVFVGLIAYDTQKLKKIAQEFSGEMSAKMAIYGALSLYLDFINLFLYLLRLFGNRRN